MDWHDMKQYHHGKDSSGNDKFFIPLPLDEDGMIGRECPEKDCTPRYFKIAPGDDEVPKPITDQSASDMSQDSLCCPYCGHTAGLQKFVTHDQLEWVESMIQRDMVRTVQNMFRRTFNSSNSSSGGSFSIHLSYKPGRLPSVRHYAEKKLKRIVEYDECKSKYAVYGVAIFCPRCGRGNLHIHLQRSVDIIQGLLNAKSDLEAQAGQEIGYQLLGNCLEDCISLFEGLLRVVYSQALQIVASETIREQKLAKLKNSFQNLHHAEQIILSDLGWELFENISQANREFMEVQFAKRHVITHNLGLIDERFQAQAQT